MNSLLKTKALLIFLLLNVATSNIIAQKIIFKENFKGCSNGAVNAIVQNYSNPGPFLNWGCEGKFGRGCISSFDNIQNFPGGAPYLLAIGLKDSVDSCTCTAPCYKNHMFLAAGTPIWPQNYLLWSKELAKPLNTRQTYQFKAFVKNISRSSAEGKPSVRLQIRYLEGLKKDQVQIITPYATLTAHTSAFTWDSIQGHWFNMFSDKIRLEIVSLAPDVPAMVHDTFGYMVGMDEITLSEVCALNAPSSWCMNKRATLTSNTGADPSLDSIKWYVGNILHQTHARDSGSFTSTSDTVTFTSANPLTKVKIVRFFHGGQVDSCSSYINVIDTVRANFIITQTYRNRLELKNTSTNANRYKWYIDWGIDHVKPTSINPKVTVGANSGTITLTAYGQCDSAVTTKSFTLCTWSPPLSFDTVSTRGLSVTYRASGFFDSTNAGMKFFWYFGDGTSLDGSQTATHVYPVRQKYLAQLVASKASCGIDTASRLMNLCQAVPDFTMAHDSICYDDSVYVHSPYNNARSYSWYINNSLASTQQNTYLKLFFDTTNKVKLIVNTGCGTKTLIKNIYVSPQDISEFKFKVAYPAITLSATFSHASSYSWEIRNVSNALIGSSNAPSLDTTISTTGNYTVCLTTVYKGCTKITCKKVCISKDIRDCCKGCATSN